jgi:cytosine/adenosine deaminase-related metal-dependent hydrolase
MNMKRTLITARVIITMDDAYHVYENGYLVVEDGRIVRIGSGEGPTSTMMRDWNCRIIW